MSVHKDKVIVLRNSRFGESDLIIKALNQNGALMSFIAKGAVKSRKRFAGGLLEPGCFIGLEYKKARASSLHFLCQAWILERFSALRANYDRLNMALHFLSLVGKISQEGVEDCPDLFNLLGNSLKALENTQDLLALQFIFEFRLLLSQGVLPKELQGQKELFNLTIAEHKNLTARPFYTKFTPAVHKAVQRYVCGG